jgi:fucose permease
MIPLAFKFRIPQEQEHDDSKPKNCINRRTELLICLLLFIFPAQEAGIGGWMPTYAIKAGITTAGHSSVYGIYFWLPRGICTIVWSLFVTASVSQRLNFIYLTLTATGFLLVVLQLL